MRKPKKTFLLYYDQAQIWEGLSDSQAGKLIKLLHKNSNSKPPKADKLIEFAYNIIKSKIDTDYLLWEEKCNKNKEIAKKGWKKRRTLEQANASERIQTDATYADNDNDNDNDNEFKDI